jgi:hypothetical protein
MPITISWGSRIINIPQSYLTLLSGTRYQLDLDQFRLDLKDLEDSPEGIVFPTTHNHNTQVTLSGVTYARTLEIINGYTVTFQNTGTPYTVDCTGANHNLGDVTNFDGGMSLIVNNAAGLIVSTGPSLVDANILSIDGSTQSALLMRIASETMIVGTVAAVLSDSEIDVTFSDFSTEETTSLEGRRIIFTSGSKAKEAARITSYAGQGVGPARLGVTQLSSVPSIGATVVVV